MMAGGKVDINNNAANQMKRKLPSMVGDKNGKREMKSFKADLNNSLRGGKAGGINSPNPSKGRPSPLIKASKRDPSVEEKIDDSMEPPSEMQAMLARMEGYFDHDLSDKSDDEDDSISKSESTKDFLDKIRESLETDESSSFLDNLGESLDVDLSAYGKSFRDRERSSSEESTKIIDEVGSSSLKSSSDDPFRKDRDEDNRNKNSSKETVIKYYKSKIEAMTKKYRQIRTEKDKSQRDKDKSEEDFKKEISERDSEIDELRNCRGGGSRTEREYQELNNTLESFLAEREDYKDEITKLEKERDKANERSKNFQKEHKHLDNLAKMKKSEADLMKISKDKLEEENTLMKEKIAKMKSETLQQNLSTDRLNNEIASLKSELSELKEDTNLCNVDSHESLQDYFDQIRESFVQNNKIKYNSGGDISDEQATKMICEILKEHNNLKEHYVKEIRNSIEKLRGMASKLQQKEKDANLLDDKVKHLEKEKETLNELSKNLAQANSNLKQKTTIVDSLNKNCQVWSEKFTTLKQEMEKRKVANEDEKKSKSMLAKSEEEHKMLKKKYADTLLKLESLQKGSLGNQDEESKKTGKINDDEKIKKEKEDLEKKLKFAKQHVTELDAKNKDLEAILATEKSKNNFANQTTETGKVAELKKLLTANEQQLVKAKSEASSIKGQLTKSQQDAEQIKKISLDKIKQTAADVDQRWSKQVKDQKMQIDDYKLKVQILEAYNTQLRTRLGLPLDKNKAYPKEIESKVEEVDDEEEIEDIDDKDPLTQPSSPTQRKPSITSSNAIVPQVINKTGDSNVLSRKSSTIQPINKSLVQPSGPQSQGRVSITPTNNLSQGKPTSSSITPNQQNKTTVQSESPRSTPKKGQVIGKNATQTFQVPTPKKTPVQLKPQGQLQAITNKDSQGQMSTPKKPKISNQVLSSNNKSNNNNSGVGIINGTAAISSNPKVVNAVPMPKLNVKSVTKLMEDRMKNPNPNNTQTQKLLAALQPIPPSKNNNIGANKSTNMIHNKSLNASMGAKPNLSPSVHGIKPGTNNSSSSSNMATIANVAKIKAMGNGVSTLGSNKSITTNQANTLQNSNLKRQRSDSIAQLKTSSSLPINSKVSISKVSLPSSTLTSTTMASAAPKKSNISSPMSKSIIPIQKLSPTANKPGSINGRIMLPPKARQVIPQIKQDVLKTNLVSASKNNDSSETNLASSLSQDSKPKSKLSIRDIMSMTKKPEGSNTGKSEANIVTQSVKQLTRDNQKDGNNAVALLPVTKTLTKIDDPKVKSVKLLPNKLIPLTNGKISVSSKISPEETVNNNKSIKALKLNGTDSSSVDISQSDPLAQSDNNEATHETPVEAKSSKVDPLSTETTVPEVHSSATPSKRGNFEKKSLEQERSLATSNNASDLSTNSLSSSSKSVLSRTVSPAGKVSIVGTLSSLSNKKSSSKITSDSNQGNQSSPKNNLEASNVSITSKQDEEGSADSIKTESFDDAQNVQNDEGGENENHEDDDQGELSDSDLNMEDVGNYENDKGSQQADNSEDVGFAGMDDLPLE